MTSFTKAGGFAKSPFKWCCVFLTFMVSILANAQNTSNNFSQVTTNPPQNPVSWIYGILNKHNSQYTEGMAVPERIALKGVSETADGSHTLTFKLQYTRKNNTNYAFDFLTSWSTAVANAGGKLDQLSTVECSPHSGQTLPLVCGDAGHVYTGTITGEPGLDAVNSNGDLAAYLDNGTDRYFTIYSTVPVTGATITANPTPETDGSNSYLLYTISWTNNNAANTAFDVVIEFAAHLAKTETGYNGSGFIKGAPYHIKLDQLDGGSLGSQDNNVTVYQNTCDVQTTDATLTTCATPGATVDLTSAGITTGGVTVNWFYDADLTQPIDPGILNAFPASNTSVYAEVSNGTCESVATVTIQVNPLPEVTCPGNSEICISTAAYALTGGSPSGGTYSGDGVSNGIFDPSAAGVGAHTITYSYTDANTCSNSCSFTITVDAASVGGTVSSDATVCRSGNSGTLTLSGYTGTIVKWQSSSDNFVSDIHDITNTTATQGYSNLTQTTWFRAVVQSGVCDAAYSTPAKITVGDCATTYTKGFWASTGKEKCGPNGINRVAIDILRTLYGSSAGSCNSNKGTAVTFGSTTTGYTFSLYPNVDFYLQTDATCKPSQSYIPIQKLLPGGNTPDVLRNHTDVNWCNRLWSTTVNKVTYTLIGTDCKGSTYSSILNNLLAQTIALQFNLSYNRVLGGVHLTGTTLTFNYLDCNSAVGAQSSVQTIPCSVLNALGTTNNTIADLYVLANKVLGQEVSTVSPSYMTAALNAINVGFDGGKILVSQTGTCSSGPTTQKQLPQLQTLSGPGVVVYPNPYTSRVNFIITSPVAGRANLQVYNVLGQNVKTVYNGYLQAGQKQTVSFDVPPAMQSMLIYKLQIGDQQITGKVLQAKE